jgi:hypothetical protein
MELNKNLCNNTKRCKFGNIVIKFIFRIWLIIILYFIIIRVFQQYFTLQKLFGSIGVYLEIYYERYGYRIKKIIRQRYMLLRVYTGILDSFIKICDCDFSQKTSIKK